MFLELFFFGNTTHFWVVTLKLWRTYSNNHSIRLPTRKWIKMNTKRIAIISMFTAVTVALVLSPLKIPAPYAPFLIYQIWEIPIVMALLLYGSSIAVSISVLNTIILLAVYPGSLPVGPLYNLAAVLSMLMGIYIVQRLARGRFEKVIGLTVSSTAIGITTRVGVMSIVNWIAMPYPYPIGFGVPPEAALVLLPIIGLFNATVALYTIPSGYFLARAISHRIPSLLNKNKSAVQRQLILSKLPTTEVVGFPRLTVYEPQAAN